MADTIENCKNKLEIRSLKLSNVDFLARSASLASLVLPSSGREALLDLNAELAI